MIWKAEEQWESSVAGKVKVEIYPDACLHDYSLVEIATDCGQITIDLDDVVELNAMAREYMAVRDGKKA